MVMLSSCNRKIGAIFSSKETLEVIDPQFAYMSAKSKLKFDHAGKKISATANFRIKKDSIIWISVSGFGIEGARVLINEKNVQILDKLKRHYYNYTFEELSKKYDFDFNFQMIQSVILGNLVEPYGKQKIEKTDSYYSYTASKGMYLFHNFIGTSSMKLEKVKVYDERTKNTISVNYSNFILVDDRIFPNDISAVIDYELATKPSTEIDIFYSKMAIENSPLSFPFSVPSKYERK